MIGDTNFDQEIRRFFEGGKGDLCDLRKSRAKRLGQTPRFFEGARQGLQVLRPAILELDRHLARKFNFFHAIAFFGSLKAEDRMSHVLAYLLDREETHGQGEMFLTAFLEHLRESEKTQPAIKQILPDGSNWSQVRVSRETRTNHIDSQNRRIDIEVSMNVGWRRVGIAIENKPWARDQDNQLSDYAKELQKRYGENFMLIYLTPDATDPGPNSIPCEERKELSDKDQLANASIREWADGWLKRAEDGVKAERVRWFVSDFRKALIESLPEPKEVAEQ